MTTKFIKAAALLFSAAMISTPSFGWGRMGHATVAKIAENHLTETTQKRIDEIMHGTALVAISSYCDDYRKQLDATFPLAWTGGVGHAHTFEVDENNRPYNTLSHPETGRHLTNAVYFADHCIQDLAHAKDFPDSVQWKEVVMLTHLMGDMHCPGHVRFAAMHENIGKYEVTFEGEKTTYHKVWDYFMVVNPLPFSFSDIAEICDNCSQDEIEEICKGDIYDWGQDVANRCQECRFSVKEGDKLGSKWVLKHTELTKIELRNAGYRLAHALNMVFDPKYARKHSK